MSRAFFDRLVSLGRPTIVAGFAPPPAQLDAGLWAIDRRLRMPGGPILPSRSTVIRLASGGLLVVSPPAIAPGGLDALDALGTVEEVFVPNSFHYLNAADFAARHPAATLRTSPGLHARVPSFPACDEIGDAVPSAWAGVVEHAVLGPAQGVAEVALFHRASATLVVTDLAFHMVRFDRAFDRVAWRLAGVPAAFGPSRSARLILLRDRAVVAPFLARVLAWPFRRVVVAHGDALETGAHDAFRRAFAPYLGGGYTTAA
jgi:hypothetical protein